MNAPLADEQFVCAQCSHWVLEDGVGFIFSDGRVQSCERCPTVPTDSPVILNEAEQERESLGSEIAT